MSRENSADSVSLLRPHSAMLPGHGPSSSSFRPNAWYQGDHERNTPAPALHGLQAHRLGGPFTSPHRPRSAPPASPAGLPTGSPNQQMRSSSPWPSGSSAATVTYKEHIGRDRLAGAVSAKYETMGPSSPPALRPWAARSTRRRTRPNVPHPSPRLTDALQLQARCRNRNRSATLARRPPEMGAAMAQALAHCCHKHSDDGDQDRNPPCGKGPMRGMPSLPYLSATQPKVTSETRT